jgi:hypothetical protein
MHSSEAPMPTSGRRPWGSAVDWILAAVAAMLFVFAVATFYFGGDFVTLLHSDASVPALLATEILRTGTLLPASWYYVNNDIWLLSPQLITLPFVALLGTTTLAQQLGNVVGLFLCVGALMLPIHRATRSWAFALVVAVGCFAPYSVQQLRVVYEQSAYGWMTAELALLAYLSLRILDVRKDEAPAMPRLGWEAAVYGLILVLIAVGNPLRAAVYWCVPIAAARFFIPDCWSRARMNRLVALTFVAFLCGAFAHSWLQGRLLVVPGIGFFLPKSAEAWIKQAEIFWRALPTLIANYSLPRPSTMLASSAAERMRWLLDFLMLAMLVLAWRSGPPEDAASLFFARLASTMLMIVVLVVVGGGLMSDVESLRYIVPQMLFASAGAMATVRSQFRAFRVGSVVASALFVLAFCGGGALAVAAPSISERSSCAGPPSICALRSALLERGLHHGYASYWNANVTTLTSSGEIRVCSVFLKPLRPMRWLVSKNCFDSPAANERYFFAMTRDEVAHLDRAAFTADTGEPDAIVSVGKYEIWVYEPPLVRLNDWLAR